ncbi:glycosyltransferase family 4 protein [Pseudodesulfovibrio sp. zrk46]|uniref:glycosyltransferase family 4 protein n=1 Tax=Pseudodesulfovibrio sp. zrk46 TaxID=2725288 RepID=UPI001449469F|nr:glycosyltransferase family 4 protein [Pseudodesulfovibrio sp. zrk46]QJB54907.1 glycosyltransferase family 4 protein [Pseudodesulfovibrio sp. zrk46]
MDVSYKEVPTGWYERYCFFSRLPHVDMFVVHRELLSQYELNGLRRICKKLVYDFSDAVWTLPEREKTVGSSIRQAKLARRFERICRQADICVVDNHIQAERVREFQENVVIVPTPVDTTRYAPGNGGKIGGTPLVGWLGTPGDEANLATPMQHLANHGGDIQFSVVSGMPYEGPGSEFMFWSAWGESNEPYQFQAMEVGVLPLADDEFANASSVVDALRYMASGVAVVASDIGPNREIIDHGIDGFLVRDEDEWASQVMRLVQDTDLRQGMVDAARRKAVEKYDLRVITDQYWRSVDV